MKNTLSIIKALADENRLKIILMLGGAELCVCHITEGLALAPSTVSKHLSILAAAGLIETRKKGRWVHCRLPEKPLPEVKGALRWLSYSLNKGRPLRKGNYPRRCITPPRGWFK